MAKRKVKLTRPEMRRQRDLLRRYERFLPILKLKQQQLQVSVRDVAAKQDEVREATDRARKKLEPYEPVLKDLAGVDFRGLAEFEDIQTSTANVAGINVPRFESATFPEARYSLFATPPWVDRALADLREIARHQAELDVLSREYELLSYELTKVTQRVNLFEKVKIPETRENIRRIRIALGDRQTAQVARAKIAKSKLAESESAYSGTPGSGNAEEAMAT
ncbi:MAG: V-type ATP synthase subunit D [Phycisphaerae bacterium]|nr:V-type ATP synthase subunit D [Phycisphaerae bacterium]